MNDCECDSPEKSDFISSAISPGALRLCGERPFPFQPMMLMDQTSLPRLVRGGARLGRHAAIQDVRDMIHVAYETGLGSVDGGHA